MDCLGSSISAMLPALKRDALAEDGNIRSRASSASLLLKLTTVDPVAVPQIECDDLPEPCRRMKSQYKVLREWARRGYVAPPIFTTWKNDRVRWGEQSCIEAVVLAQLLQRGLRGDRLADIMRRVRKTQAVTLAALAREPGGLDKLYDAEAVGV